MSRPNEFSSLICFETGKKRIVAEEAGVEQRFNTFINQ